MRKLAAFLLLLILGFFTYWGYESLFTLNKINTNKDTLEKSIQIKDTLSLDTLKNKK